MTQSVQDKPPIRLLIVDDSWVLRRVLRGTISQRDDVEIIGEAKNGIEALGLILDLKPDVVLLDMEMPTMDGMTTLQHLMIHTPTPTVMLSSLSKQGSMRCFDALKYGAVDFVSKNSFFQGMDGAAHSKLVLNKIFNASKIVVKSIDPMQQNTSKLPMIHENEKVVFCEECGTRQLVKNFSSGAGTVKCRKCGDLVPLKMDKRYKRMNYITVIGAGESGYSNLLKIIPTLNPEMGGALCVMILDAPGSVETFVKYLDAISDFEVTLGHNGATLEGGCCYVFSREDDVSLSPYSGNYAIQIEAMASRESTGNFGAIDSLMISTASLLTNRVAGVLLSGSTTDGSKGMERIAKENGTCFGLSPGHCLHKTMINDSMERFKLQGDLDENSLAIEIQKCHLNNKENVITA